MIVVAGEALLDVFVAGNTPDGVTMNARIGGSPFNVAIGLARLRQPVAFLGAIGQGQLGERLQNALLVEGVDVSCVQRVKAPTTLGLIAVDAAGVPDYAFYADGAADRQLSLAALDKLPQATRAIHVGSYATVVAPIAQTLEALIEREHRQRLIAYDPNVRLNVEPRLECWHHRIEWMLTRTHLLKISEEDIHLLYPDIAPRELASRWQQAGVAVVIVTKGEHGALGWCADGTVEMAAVGVKVKDTVGAGDSFQAAMLAWFAEQGLLSAECLRKLSIDQLRSAMSFAAQAGALTCSRSGADLPRRAELPGTSAVLRS